MRTAVTTPKAEQLLILTHEMLASAEASDWDKLTELETLRLPLFDLVFAKGIATHVELVQEILSTDEKTKQLTEAGMSEVQQELLKLRGFSQAKNAYQAVQNSANEHS